MISAGGYWLSGNGSAIAECHVLLLYCMLNSMGWQFVSPIRWYGWIRENDHG
jgi:hypothetical protein